MDITQGESKDGPGFTRLKGGGDLVVSVDGTGIGAFNGFAVRVKLVVAYMVGKRFARGVEKQGYPANMMFRRVRVRHLFAQPHRHLKHFICFDRIRALDDRDMFLDFPISFLK